MTARATYCEQTRAPSASNVSSMPGEHFLRIKGNVTVLPFSFVTFSPSHCRTKRGYLSSSEFPTTSRWFRPRWWSTRNPSIGKVRLLIFMSQASLWSAAGPRQQSLLIFKNRRQPLDRGSESVKNGPVMSLKIWGKSFLFLTFDVKMKRVLCLFRLVLKS